MRAHATSSSRLRRAVVAAVAFAVGSIGIAQTVEAAGPCGPDQLVVLDGVEVCAHVDSLEDVSSGLADRVPGGLSTIRSGILQAQSGQQGVAAFDTAANHGTRDGAEDHLELVCDRSSNPRRVEVLYGHPAGANRLGEIRTELEDHVRFAQLQYDFSAFVAGSERAWLPRFVTEGTGEDCRIRIEAVQLSSRAITNVNDFFNELLDKGFDDPNRAYLVFVEDGPYCGLGTLDPTDDRPDPAVNRNNVREVPAFSRIDEFCWGVAEAHELAHNLGAVQQSAPNSTEGSHCTDGYDAMCYDDGSLGSGGYVETACSDERLQFALDCNNDDYYDPSPAPGSYLDTHWNIIDNDWLLETFTDAAISGLTVGPTGTRFDDVALSATFMRDIDDLARNGVTRGCNPPDNTEFCPADPVTREQMAAFLRRALDLPEGSATFSDVSSSNPFRADIAALAEADITRGCNPPDNSEFCPKNPVTREQMAAFLNRTGLLTE